MALATRCPHCQTAFRVASDQLKLRAGLVRCGTCKQIFNGIENLLRPDEDIAAALAGAAPPLPPVPVLGAQDNTLRPPRGDNTRFKDLIAEVDQPQPLQGAARDQLQVPSPVQPAPKDGYAASHAPVQPPAAAEERLPFAFDTTPAPSATPPGAQDSSSDALWAALDGDPALPEPADPHTAAMPGDPTAPSVLVRRGSQADLPGPAASDTAPGAMPDDDTVPDSVADVAPHGMAESEQAMPGLLRAARIDADEDLTLPIRAPLPRAAPALPEPPAEMPDFLVREQQAQGTQRVLRPALWCTGALLTLLLAAQLVYAMRSPIAATFPQTRSALDAACRTLGCLVALPMQIESVSIESSDFQPLADKRDQFMLSVVLRNRSSTVEAWPAIELSLNDTGDKTVGRRVIMPRDYLPAGLTTARGFAAGSEQALKMYFDLARLPASGYRVYLFYP